MKRKLVFYCFAAFFCKSVFAQDVLPGSTLRQAAELDPIQLIGRTVQEIIESYGAPVSVYSVRGAEDWQDDVVFEYKNLDFYFYKDKVWQISIKRGLGINVGDSRATALLLLGENTQDKGNHILKTLTGMNWPLQWRFSINKSGKVSAIYLYRMDY
ncbi:MAG: hypothetical protein LBV52_00135 [Spirochaetaceae bacterium]|jgi:hypothetical protein|nr:hypothetical protein [Spirochaetaceae bacterium]